MQTAKTHLIPTKHHKAIDTRKSLKLGSVDLYLSEDFEKIRSVWVSLQDHCSLTIYQDYEWQKAWFETIGLSKGGKPLFLTAFRAQDPIFLIPLFIERKGGLTIATWMGGNHANYRFGLFRNDETESSKTALSQFFTHHAASFLSSIDIIDLPQQPAQWDGIDNPIIAALPHDRYPTKAASVFLNGNFAAVLAKGNAKKKRKVLNAQERTLNELGGYKIIQTDTAAAASEIYDKFLIQKNQWFDTRGIPNPFDNQPTRNFFIRLAEISEQSSGPCRLIRYDYLKTDNKVIAILANGTFRNQNFGYFTSMTSDEKYKRISPGALLFYKRIEKACNDGLRRFDFGVGGERYKTSWCDEIHSLFNVRIPLSTKGYIYAAVLKLKNAAKHQLKENDALWAFTKKLRRHIKPNNKA